MSGFSWRHPGLRWPVLFLAWTLVGLSFAAQFYLASAQAGAAVSWRQALSGALGDWYVFALLSAPTVLLVRRFPFGRENWAKSLIAHLAGGVAFSLAFMALRSAVAEWQGWAAGRPVAYGEVFRLLLVKTWHFNLLIYWVIVIALQAVGFYRESQDRARRALELEKRLTEARLMALQMQLNPHFLFNALNGIATLMHRDVDTADRMLVRLAELLRMSLEKTGAQEVPLRQEMELLNRYLDIERLRFGERLAVKVDVSEEALEAKVPTLVLQPLVENALQHGLRSTAQRGTVEVFGRRDGEMLTLEVRDNGTGLKDGTPARNGVGLGNTRARLQQLYGEKQSFAIANRPEGGVQVRLTLPFQTTK